MLTGEEQWKILQKEERRMGRRKRKKKTLTKQLEEMGGFGQDPDREQAIIEELNRSDTRAPLQHSQASISECEVSIGESSFLESTTRLFRSWIFQASRRQSKWIQEKDLPLFFRFALRRPLMDERSFQNILKTMNLQLYKSKGNARQPLTPPVGRSRKLLFGIDMDPKKDVHPSARLRNALPRGTADDGDRAREEATRIVQHDDEDMQELLRTQLSAVYEHVQNGSVPLEKATWHYRDAFDDQDMSDETLLLRLQQFGIPTDHISSNERNFPQGSTHCQTPSTGETESITALSNYVGLYRSGALHENEAIHMVQHHLQGLKIDADNISDILTDLGKDEKTAALLIWEDACDDDDDASMSSGTLSMLSSSSSSPSEEDGQADKDQKNLLRAVIVSDQHLNEGKDHNTTEAVSVDENKPPDHPSTEDIAHQDDCMEKKSQQSEAMSIDQPFLSPTAFPSSKLSINSHAVEAGSRVLPPGTPRPNYASLVSTTKQSDSQADLERDREPPRDRAITNRGMTSSPDEGMTTGIWGLLMPTKEARKLAYKLKLPQQFINEQVRSISPRRVRREKASFAKTVVTCPKSKRKASISLHKGTSPKFSKHGDHSDLFAREGEDQETFVLSHFDGDEIRPEGTCDRCLCFHCQCGFELSSCSTTECPGCFQQQCMCDTLSQVEKATRTASRKGNPPSNGPNITLVDRTLEKPPKQSITLLAFLARELDENDVLASIKQLERHLQTDKTIAYVKLILDRLQQCVHAGEKITTADIDAQEALRVLNIVVNSSHILTNHLLKLEALNKHDPTVNVDGCHDDLQEAPDLDSSLLNSSPGYEHVHAPLSGHITSAAAFPEQQSNIANDAISQANNTSLAKCISPHLPTAAPDSRVPDLKPCSGTEDAPQSPRLQTATTPDPSTTGDPSKSENRSGSSGGGKSSAAGGRSSQPEFPPESPAKSPLSSTRNLSEQVSDHPIDVEGDTDHTPGAPLTEQPHSDSQRICNNDAEAPQPDDNVSPPPPRAKAKQVRDSTPPSSPRLSLKSSSKHMSPATPRLRSSRDREATSHPDSSGPGFDSLPLWPPPGLPNKAGIEWTGMTPQHALDHAKEKAYSERKTLACYLEERRAVRTRIKKENDLANSKWSECRFFQNSNGLSGSSGTATTQALNKLFDKYRGRNKIYLDLRTKSC